MKNIRVIKLKEHWDTKDSTLVSNDRMTETGLSAYWRAVDVTFEYNQKKRELFLAKTTVQQNQPAPQSVMHHPHRHSEKLPAEDKDHRYVAVDPMGHFFRKHRRPHHAEFCMETREERHSGRFRQDDRAFDRFILPRPHHHRY